jgi:hypothetical protein
MVGDFFMNKDVEFLNSIYQNAEMGIIGINNLMDYKMDNRFKRELVREIKEYKNICDESYMLLKRYYASVKHVSPMLKLMTRFIVVMTIKDDDTKYMAKQMIEGINKGIIGINQDLNNYKYINKKLKDLAHKHLFTLQNNIDGLKAFL